VFLYTLMQPVGNLEAVIPITNMDFRNKLSAMLALGFHKKIDDDWFSNLNGRSLTRSTTTFGRSGIALSMTIGSSQAARLSNSR